MTARELVDLAPLVEGFSAPVTFGVDCAGAIYVAAGRATESLTEERTSGIFPKSRLVKATEYVVCRWHGGDTRSIVIRDAIVVSFVQPTRHGVLLVGGRCHWHPSGAEKNAAEYTWDGLERQRFTLGDGIQDVRATPDGSVWVSYFDEGVFGNYGWGHPGPIPIGAPGCVAFDEGGRQHFAFSADEAKTDVICDAYAINVSGDDDVWLYFYTQFPIVHVSRRQYRTWSFDIGGARALAVEDGRALLYGDYKVSNLVRIARLGDNGRAEVCSQALLVDEQGNDLGRAVAFGVGRRLFLFDGLRALLVEDW